MGFLFTMVGIIELISGTGIAAAQAGSDREPGDFALDPLKFCADPELKVGGRCWMAAGEWRLAPLVCASAAEICTRHKLTHHHRHHFYQAKYKLAEITHARLAMIAFSGLITQAVGVSDQFPYVGF